MGKSGMCIPFEPSLFSLVSQLWDPEVGVDYVFSWSRQLLSCITENRTEQWDQWKDDVLGKVSIAAVVGVDWPMYALS